MKLVQSPFNILRVRETTRSERCAHFLSELFKLFPYLDI